MNLPQWVRSLAHPARIRVDDRHFPPHPVNGCLAAFLLLLAPLVAIGQELPAKVLAPVAVAPVVEAVKATKKASKKLEPPPEFLKKLVNSELSFVKRVCHPSDDQMSAIVEAATRAYQKMADLINEPNQQFFVGNKIRIMGPANEQLKENPYTRIRRDVKQYLKPLVSTKQFQQYEAEAKARDDFERTAAIQIVVGIIDSKLVLTEDQQTQLQDQLMKGWKNIDIDWLKRYLFNPQYLPQVPDKIVTDILTPPQRKSWETFQKTQMSMHLGMQQNAGIREEWIP